MENWCHCERTKKACWWAVGQGLCKRCQVLSFFNPQEVCCWLWEKGEGKKRERVSVNVSSRHKRRKLLTSLFLKVEVPTIHMQLTLPHLFSALPLPLYVFCVDCLFVEDCAMDSRCLTQQSGCLVTWIYNCFLELVLQLKGLLQPFNLCGLGNAPA